MSDFVPTHESADGARVRAKQWKKDGDDPRVERYPIEKRDYKGIMRVESVREGEKAYRLALKFGDWIVEDEKGRVFIVGADFSEKFKAIEAGPSAAVVAVLALLAITAALFSGEPVVPVLFGVTHLLYYTSLLAQWNGSANIFDLDEAADDIKVAAATNTYSISQDTHDFFDDITNEVTGTNYTAGGAAIGSQTLTRSTNTVTFDGADVVWTQSGAGFSTARKFPVYRNSGVASTSRLFSVVTADADVGNLTGDLTIAWNASGIATWSTT